MVSLSPHIVCNLPFGPLLPDKNGRRWSWSTDGEFPLPPKKQLIL